MTYADPNGEGPWRSFWWALALAMLVVAAIVIFSSDAKAQQAGQWLRGAIGFRCQTVAAVVEWNQRTAFMSDAEYDAAVEHLDDLMGGECAFGPLNGVRLDIVETFSRHDGRVIDVYRCVVPGAWNVYFYIFQARPLEEGRGA